MNSNVSHITFKRPRSDDPFLRFDPSSSSKDDDNGGSTTLLRYYNKMRDFTVPYDHLNLLEHFTYFSLFIETIIINDKSIKKLIKESEREEEKVDWEMEMDYFQFPRHKEEEEDNEEESSPLPTMIDKSGVCSLAWKLHNTLRLRKTTSFTSLYAISYLMSWSSFCRSYYLKRVSTLTKEDLSKTAMDFTFTQKVSNTKSIIASDQPIMTYSLRELWNAIRLVISSLYTYSFSNDMKDYIYHLFIRYCNILTVSCKSIDEEKDVLDDSSFFKYNKEDEEDDGNNNDDDDDEKDEEDDDEEEDFYEYKKTCIPVNDRYSIKSNYLYEGELIFYHQLCRINLSVTFHLLHDNKDTNRLFLQGIDDIENDNQGLQEKLRFIEKTLNAWSQFMEKVSVHDHVSPSLKEIFRTLIMNIYLYHGERERYIRNYPESNHEAGDVLNEFRPDDFNEVQSFRKLVIQKITDSYHKSFIDYLNDILIKTFDIRSGGGINEGSSSGRRRNESSSTTNTYRPSLQMSNKTPSTTFSMPFSLYNDNNNLDHLHGVDIHSNDIWIEERENIPCFTYEKECILATKVSIFQWFRYNQVEKAKEINDAFIMEELQESMESIDEIFTAHRMYVSTIETNVNKKRRTVRTTMKKKKNNKGKGDDDMLMDNTVPSSITAKKKQIPYLVPLQRIHYVIDINDIENVKIYKSKIFFKAFFVWLTLLVRYKLVKKKALHASLVNMVNDMNVILK